MSRTTKRVIFYVIPVLFFTLVLTGILVEAKTSRIQAYFFYKKVKGAIYSNQVGPDPNIIYPKYGPHDERLGYTLLPKVLKKEKWNILQQAHWTTALRSIVKKGWFPPYQEPLTKGLSISDANNEIIFSNKFPKFFYNKFEEIPPLVLKTLLFIEDREILDNNPYKNPVIDANRLTGALFKMILKKLGFSYKTYGASTLATQLTKFKHSNNGKTDSMSEKFRQMMSASLLSYSKGKNTLETRKQIILDFINNVPLGASPKHGEVLGIGDGLNAWFGARLDKESQVLNHCNWDIYRCGMSYRMILALFLAQRRPSYYLSKNRKGLDDLVNSYLSPLHREKIISINLADATYNSYLAFQDYRKLEMKKTKSVSDINKVHLLSRLGVNDIYTLDRLDLNVKSTIYKSITEGVNSRLGQLVKEGDPSLIGKNLLKNKNQKDLIFSFLLYERMGNHNALRIQTDQFPTRFSLNDSMKLELGSTSKLRTLVTYLELIENNYFRFKNKKWILKNKDQVYIHPKDKMSSWVKEWVEQKPNGSLLNILEDSMERKFSGSEGEPFFTGSGIHYFRNFEGKGGGMQTVRNGLYRSINLVYIRIMRDIVNHLMYQGEKGVLAEQLLSGELDILRQAYLNSFVQKEGDVFIGRYFLKYYQNSPISSLIKEIKDRDKKLGLPLLVRAKHLVGVYAVRYQKSNPDDLWKFLYNHGIDLSGKKVDEFYRVIYETKLDLQDFGYLAKKHPLELWVASYLEDNPNAKLNEVSKAAEMAKVESYRWFFSPRKIHRQNVSILTLLEEEAFKTIEERWKDLGFPFKVIPSYASAIGVSGDRPVSLAKLMGIIVNDGNLCPTEQIEYLHFAKGTPYETLMSPKNECKRVLSSEVASVVKEALAGVVEQGTAVRLKGAINKGSKITVIGGKTGTGDNRFAKKQVKNRTGTFVFYIGERYFGVITVFVDGKKAGNYSFTSSLPLQVTKLLLPILNPLL